MAYEGDDQKPNDTILHHDRSSRLSMMLLRLVSVLLVRLLPMLVLPTH